LGSCIPLGGHQGSDKENGFGQCDRRAHPATPVEFKKCVLRTVLREIVIDTTEEPSRNELRLQWQGGVHPTLNVRRNPRRRHSGATCADALELIRELSKVCDDRAIAAVLNQR